MEAREQLRKKVEDCYKESSDSWLMKQPIDLIERAEEIAAVQRMRDELPDAVTEEDATYLLRFKNPLEVVADRWQSMNGSGSIADEDMRHILWELQDRGDAELDKKLPMSQKPHAWTNGGKTEWYGFTPTAADYDKLIAAVSDYAELYEAPELRMEQSMS